MPASDIGLIATAVAEIARVIAEWQKSSERRRMQAAIEAAEKYIQVNEHSGDFEKITEEQQAKYLKHYRKRFFTYNN